MSATCWFIRAGDDSRHASEFVRGGVVAIGWGKVPGLEDLRGLSRDDISGLVRDSGTSKTAAADGNEMILFRDEVEIGHVVVMPDATSKEVLIGEITGDYTYLDPSPAGDYHHVRTTAWLRRWPRHQVPEGLLEELRYRRTIRRLTHQDEWAMIVERMRNGEGRLPDAVGAGPTARPSTRRPPPVEQPTKLCPGCGLRRVATQFVPDTDLCTDCR